MISARKTLRGGGAGVEINMAPLIDMVFLLLIFFAVSTSFVRESGVDVQRASASTARVMASSNIMIGVTMEGDVYFEGKRIDIRSVRAHIERALAGNAETGVVVVADKRSETGAIVTVMDQCRLAGAKSVSLAAKREDAP